MRILVTGANGFIGSAVVRRLVAEGEEVVALVRPGADLGRLAAVRDQIQLLQGDLLDADRLRQQMEQQPPELCLHLAWYAEPGKYLAAEENLDCVRGSLDLLRLLHRLGCPRVAAAGTCLEYDPDAGYLSEASPTRPQSLYASCKLGLSEMARRFCTDRAMSLVWIRIFYQYGPWEDTRRLVPVVVRKLLAGERCTLTPGTQIRDYLHVDDVAAAFVTAALSPLEGPVNIGSGKPVTVAEVAALIGECLERTDLIDLGAVPSTPADPPFIVASTGRLAAATGWTPRYTLQEGLRDTIRWWRGQVGVRA